MYGMEARSLNNNIMKILACLFMIFALKGCNAQEKSGEKTNGMNISLKDTSDVKMKKLIETVLNLPDVIRFSEINYIRRDFAVTYIYFEQDSLRLLRYSIYQGNYPLKILDSLVGVNTMEGPYYVFRKISVVNNEAYVHVEFDITGATAWGKLYYVNDQWVPSKDFIVGLR